MRFLAALALVLAACSRAPTPPLTGVEATAPAIGVHAPTDALTSAAGERVALAERWQGHPATIVVFYRGFF
jgi:hypothetical protein